MQRLRGHITVLSGLVMLLLVLTPAVPATGQAATSWTVGTSTITFSADWEVNTSDPDLDTLWLAHRAIPDTIYLYDDFANPSATDPSTVLNAFEEGIFSGFGDGNQQVVASGALPPSSDWRLYSVSRGGVPFGLLVSVDVTSQPGRVMQSMLAAPVASFAAATQAVLDTIDLNGTGSPLAGLEPTALGSALTSTGPVHPTPMPAHLQPTATAGPASGLQLPPLQPTTASTASETTVAGVTIRYGDSWIYDDLNSVPNEWIYLDATDGSLLRFYGFLAEEDPGIDAVSARDLFTDTYFDTIGAISVQQLAAGESPNGTAWSLHRADLSGEPILVLVYADTVSTAGQVHIHQLVTDPDDLQPALAEAQSSIQANGVAVFRDVDPAAVSGDGAAEAALPEAYLGTWEGTGTEADPSVTWPVSVTFRGGGIDAVVGTASYPTLDCRGDFILRHIDPTTGTIEVMEDITAGEANCVDGGIFLFAASGEGQQLSFTWTGPDGTGSAEGILTPVQMSSQPVGASTLSFGADWVRDVDTTDTESIRLTHAEIPSTAYLYMDVPDASATDTSAAFSGFDAGFFNGFGDGDQQVVASGALAPGADWRLYSVSRNGVPFGVLVTADITTQPGRLMTSVLLAPVGSLGTATQAVLDTIDRNGTGSPLAGVDPAALEAELGGGAAGE